MKAMLLDRQAKIETAPLRHVEVPDPAPTSDELLVNVHVCGVCRTDLHVIEGDLPSHKRPLIPGHQVVGTVVAAGSSSRGYTPGQRVGIAWLRRTCGACEYCGAGSENLCKRSLYTGYDADGGYAELAVVPAAYAYAIPDALDDERAAPLLCAGIIGYRALQTAQVPARGKLALYGFGSSAHVVMQLARSRGCSVSVATRGETHRRLALELGADWAGGAADPLPHPVDAAIVFAPAGELVPVALRAVRPGGVVVMAGISMTPVPEMDYESCLFHEKKLVSVEANTRADGEAFLREAVAARIRPRVTCYPLDEANQALQHLKQDRIDGSAVLLVRNA
jgi:propanol-preferring alcohol dehydrogenase